MRFKNGLILLTILLCGCQQMSQKKSQYVPNHANDYLSSHIIAPLRVPEGLNYPKENESFSLPSEIPDVAMLKPIPLEPPGFGKLN